MEMENLRQGSKRGKPGLRKFRLGEAVPRKGGGGGG